MFTDAEKAREHLEATRWPQAVHSYGRNGVRAVEDSAQQMAYGRSPNVRQQKGHHLQVGLVHGPPHPEAMREDADGPLGGGGGGGTVEADETFWGNKKPRGQKNGRGDHHKEKILSLVERGGKVRSFYVPAVNAATLKPIIKAQISDEARLMTDDAGQYVSIGKEFAEHGVVKHGIGEYVRGDVHTNTIEGYFSILKRGLVGTFHHVGKQHLKRYAGEFDFRYNYRAKNGYDDKQRAMIALRGIEGKRLMYTRPSS